jgi:serine phosphatase RsbU (regulator of sigma subunit)
MVGALADVTERKIAELAAVDARERELKIGFNIQQALLMADVPSELDGAWISTHVEPSQGLHGDFIAVSRHSSTRFCLLVGDVMGKGIHAAMIGAGIKNAFYQVLAELLAQAIDTRILPDPATIINALHRKVTPQLINMDCFVTLALYVFDAAAGTVAVVNAGHTDGLLLRFGSSSVEPVVGENLPLGVLASEVYVQHVLSVADDDYLVMYSDGISEVCNQDGEEFGSAGIAAWLLGSRQAGLTGELALQQLRQQLAQFRASSRMVDDQTVVMIRLRSVRPLASSMAATADGFLCSFDI